MSNDTKFGRLSNEVVSGGTQRDADAPAPLHVTIAGIIGWIALFAFVGWRGGWWAVAFVIGLALSIILHEFGHFWTARKSGMKATQFFLGFGPRLWSFKRGETEYGVRAVPLGGFVKIIGMTNMDEVPEEDEARTYRQGTYARRMWVITAGSVMHVIIALVLIVSVYGIWGRVEESGRLVLYKVSENTPAAQAGLQEGDVITSMNGTKITSYDQFTSIIADHKPGDTLQIGLTRDGQPVSTSATLVQSPYANAGEVRGFLGVSSDSRDRVPQGWGDALVEGPKDLVTGLGQAATGIARVINPVNVWGHLVGTNNDLSTRPTTIVGATKISTDAGHTDGWAGLLALLAALNVSVGVINMFPLLPLDGGHAVIATYERLREKRGGKRYFADISKAMPIAAACIALLAFMFFTGLYLDIAK